MRLTRPWSMKMFETKDLQNKMWQVYWPKCDYFNTKCGMSTLYSTRGRDKWSRMKRFIAEFRQLILFTWRLNKPTNTEYVIQGSV